MKRINKTNKQMKDEQLLIAACKRGESWAFKRLYHFYAPAMMGLCMRYMGDRASAQDVLQNGFIKLFAKIDTYSELGSFAAWARRIFANAALEQIRKEAMWKQTMSIDDCEIENETDVSAVEALSAEELQKCIAALPAGYRTVFNMHAIEGYSHAEIAQILKIKESTVRTQFIRARKSLQKSVESLMIHESENRIGK